MNKACLILLAFQMVACASTHVAKNVSMLTFDEKATAENVHAVGNIEGRDCTWYVWGFPIGEDPTVRSAFQNAMNQKEDSLIPGQPAATKGAPLKGVRNVTVQDGGFNAYVASRLCVIVTGVGLQ
jgi:hypothetical protein